MSAVHFITHPEVLIDPAVPVPDWPLSPTGVRRVRLALEQPWLLAIRAVFTSAERKARDTAAIIAARLHIHPIVIPALGENDRSATGYLPKHDFEATADAFFARPEESVRGWERAVDAQRRIVAAIDQAMAEAPEAGDIAVISHGGVGALLLSHLKGVPISRTDDQPPGGGGHVTVFRRRDRVVLSTWRPIEG